MTRSAIVTGGAGFIGSHLCRRLVEDGWSVTAVDDLSSGFRSNVPEGARLVEVDLGEEPAAAALPDEPVDAVFHLASHVGQELSFESPFRDLHSNVMATMVLLDWCMRHEVPRVVFAGSMNVYGDPPDPSSAVTEETPVHPPSPYAVGKIASEHLCQVYSEYAGLSATSLRLFNVYGPGQDMANLKQGMVSIYMSYVARGEPLLVRGSGERFRDFIFVDDVVDAFVKCGTGPHPESAIYNVASGRRTHVHEVIGHIIRAFGHDPADYPIEWAEGTPRDQFGIFGDAGRLSAERGWEPTVPVEDGVARMAEWVKSEMVA